MPQKKIELSKPRDFGEIINDTFLFVRQNFKPLMKYFFIFCGIFLFASIVASVVTQLKVIRTFTNYNPDSFDNDDILSRYSFLSLRYLISLFFLLLQYSAINVMVLCYVTLYRQKQNNIPTTEEMWGYFKFYYLKILGAAFILGILTILGCFLCFLPGIYLGVVFSLVAPIMIIENASFGYAFNQCFRLIKDNWWVTFGALIVIGIMLYVVRMIIVVPSAIVNMSSIVSPGVTRSSVYTITTIISTILVQMSNVFQMLAIVTVSLCYFNLSESKDATSLLERMNQFGQAPSDSNINPEEY